MNSSISSSSPPAAGVFAGGEWKVLLSLALLLMGTEFVLHLTERRLSIDVDHIRSAPQLAETISKDSNHLKDTLKILFIGNSSIRRGIDSQMLEEEFQTRYGLRIRSYFFYPDGGNIVAWRWAWRRYFSAADCRPDLVVVCGGASHFDDGKLDPRTLATYFVSNGDIWNCAWNELSGAEERLEFFAAKASLSYASRKRVQRRVMDVLMPHNREVLLDMVSLADKSASGKKITNSQTQASESLRELLKEICAKGLKAVIVAMPNLINYEVPESRKRTILETGAAFVDLRRVQGINDSHFYDKAHLDQAGAVIFTRALSTALHHALPVPAVE